MWIHQGKKCRFKLSRAGLLHPQHKKYMVIIMDTYILTTTSQNSLRGTIRFARVAGGPSHKHTVTLRYSGTNAPKYWFTGTILFQSLNAAFQRSFIGMKTIHSMIERKVLNKSLTSLLPHERRQQLGPKIGVVCFGIFFLHHRTTEWP